MVKEYHQLSSKTLNGLDNFQSIPDKKPAHRRVYKTLATYQICFKYGLFCCILQARLKEIVKFTSHFCHFEGFFFLIVFKSHCQRRFIKLGKSDL